MSKTAETKSLPLGPSSLFWTKATYKYVADEFHPFHRHDLNVLLHLFTTGIGVWGAVQAAELLGYTTAIYIYAALTALTTPALTAVLHSAMLYAMLQVAPPAEMVVYNFTITPLLFCGLAVASGYGLQDLAHWLCQEKTYMDSYIGAKPYMLLVHSFWLLPLVIDAVLMRHCFLPNLVSRNRCVFTKVASVKAVDDLRTWINTNIPSIPETTHVWPHREKGTDGPVTALENDSAILAGFRRVFAAKHFDVMAVQDMNEIYVTAVGAKKDINSDAVFYTPHTDGPYWFLPFASLYRVLVGVTPNKMVRTRFNLQHESEDKVVDIYDVLGFDYSRELHWIDHVPGAKNDERRSLIKLHFIVYPKGWHAYGRFCAKLNTNYNTWARGNFLRTLRPSSLYEYALAWWIWLTTWTNQFFECHFGWSNLTYVLAAYCMGPTPFLLLTSFRHYMVYISTFAYRKPAVAHGYLMRDAKVYKTISMMHLARRILPLVQLPQDTVGVALAMVGFATTLAATARLGMVRTYFGTELGFVPPKWISGFPYGIIPHPMIVGQIFAFGSILAWFGEGRLGHDTVVLLVAHMTFYAVHMIQEILTSSY